MPLRGNPFVEKIQKKNIAPEGLPFFTRKTHPIFWLKLILMVERDFPVAAHQLFTA